MIVNGYVSTRRPDCTNLVQSGTINRDGHWADKTTRSVCIMQIANQIVLDQMPATSHMTRRWAWIAALCLMTCSSASMASSEAAWKAHDLLVSKACLAASKLEEPKAASQLLAYPDKIGYTALLIEGRIPKSKPNLLALGNPNIRRELCMYQRKTRKVTVQELLPPIK
jgi:hypothetical protein